jgi:glycosyltransferase involved in cell wall biosynthesis
MKYAGTAGGPRRARMTSPLRILFLTPLYPPAVGGAAEHYGQLSAGLANHPQVERLVVLTERHPQAAERESLPKGTVLRCLPPWLSLPRGSLYERARRRLRAQWRLWKTVPEIVENERINIIQIHSTSGYAFAPLLGRLARKAAALVGDLQDNIFDVGLFRRCSRVVCCSENTFARAREYGLPDAQVLLVPLPFSPASVARREGLPEDSRIKEPYICFAGSLSARKGIYELLEAFPRFRESRPAFSLLMAGVNHDGNRFLIRARNAGAAYVGPVSHAQALNLMARAALVVLPSKSEGLPRVCLEALALGKKVLLPPGIPEFDRHCPEFVVPGITPAAIAEKMKEILDSEKQPAYPWSGHEPEKAFAAYMNVYRGALDGLGTSHP